MIEAPSTKLPVAALVGVFLLLSSLAGSTRRAMAEPTAKKLAHRSQPARAAQSAPDRTGSIAKPQTEAAGKASTATASDNEAVPEPVYLPDVPRTRMRACGELWRQKKLAGDTGDGDWRDFAFHCLSAETKAGQN